MMMTLLQYPLPEQHAATERFQSATFKRSSCRSHPDDVMNGVRAGPLYAATRATESEVSMPASLTNRRIAVLAKRRFEKVELTLPATQRGFAPAA